MGDRIGGPVETVSVSTEFRLTRVPAFGLVPITTPLGTVSLVPSVVTDLHRDRREPCLRSRGRQLRDCRDGEPLLARGDGQGHRLAALRTSTGRWIGRDDRARGDGLAEGGVDGVCYPIARGLKTVDGDRSRQAADVGDRGEAAGDQPPPAIASSEPEQQQHQRDDERPATPPAADRNRPLLRVLNWRRRTARHHRLARVVCQRWTHLRQRVDRRGCEWVWMAATRAPAAGPTTDVAVPGDGACSTSVVNPAG